MVMLLLIAVDKWTVQAKEHKRAPMFGTLCWFFVTRSPRGSLLEEGAHCLQQVRFSVQSATTWRWEWHSERSLCFGLSVPCTEEWSWQTEQDRTRNGRRINFVIWNDVIRSFLPDARTSCCLYRGTWITETEGPKLRLLSFFNLELGTTFSFSRILLLFAPRTYCTYMYLRDVHVKIKIEYKMIISWQFVQSSVLIEHGFSGSYSSRNPSQLTACATKSINNGKLKLISRSVSSQFLPRMHYSSAY